MLKIVHRRIAAMKLTNVLFKAASTIYETIGSGESLCFEKDAVLIIGGSSNKYGVEICRELVVARHIRVVNIDIRDIDNAWQALNGGLEHYTFVPCNSFMDETFVIQAILQVLKLDIPVNLLINNLQEGFETLYNSEFEGKLSMVDKIQNLNKCVTVNVTNVMIATKYYINSVIPHILTNSGNGTVRFYIINVSYEQPDKSLMYASHYLSSKMALNQFHDGLASELQGREKGKIGNDEPHSIKALLVYLPYILDIHAYTELCPIFAQNLINCLEEGRIGTKAISKKL